MTRSPGRKMNSPKRRSGRSSAGRVQGLLEGPVQAAGARAAACGWGRAPGSGRAGMPMLFGQPAAAPAPRWSPPPWAGSRRRRKKKSPPVVPQVGQLPPVDLVGVADDGALGGLAENFGQAHGGHHPAADEVGKQVARPHARAAGPGRPPAPGGSPPAGRTAGPRMRVMSTMEVSSTMTASAFRGSLLVVGEDQPAGVGVIAGSPAGGGWWPPPRRTAPPAAWPPGRWGRPGRSPAPGRRRGPALPAGRWSCRCPARR